MVQSRHWIEMMLLMRLKLFEILVQATVIYGRSPTGETHGFGVFKNIVTHIKALVLQCFEYSGINVVPLDLCSAPGYQLSYTGIKKGLSAFCN